MGNGTSLNQKEISELQQETKCINSTWLVPINQLFLVTQKEIKRVHKRFKKLDRMEKGEVTPYEFSRIPDINKDPLGAAILIELFVTLLHVQESVSQPYSRQTTENQLILWNLSKYYGPSTSYSHHRSTLVRVLELFIKMMRN